jgi:hypothetical protein
LLHFPCGAWQGTSSITSIGPHRACWTNPLGCSLCIHWLLVSKGQHWRHTKSSEKGCGFTVWKQT